MANDDMLIPLLPIKDGETYNVESGRVTSPVIGTYSFIHQYCVASNRFAECPCRGVRSSRRGGPSVTTCIR
ncbi:hypothetical protein DPMN_114406 [Dreissena polymorpha]|uniref:Uncharacterized protein n=1 Tax=Dreissena polymorpha TaxID=45954 RepID=A0A9D4QSF4_DREPO|nr:hypothetical protein DPMN_114406 [Dreissena polymorpha]